MEWYDSLATYAIGGPVSIGSAYGTFRGLEYLINQLPQDVIMPKGPLLDRVVAGGTEVIGALAVGTALMYAMHKAHEGEWFYKARSKCGQALQRYRERRAAKKAAEEQSLASTMERLAEQREEFSGKG